MVKFEAFVLTRFAVFAVFAVFALVFLAQNGSLVFEVLDECDDLGHIVIIKLDVAVGIDGNDFLGDMDVV